MLNQYDIEVVAEGDENTSSASYWGESLEVGNKVYCDRVDSNGVTEEVYGEVVEIF